MPRLSVFRSNQHLYLQLIDDQAGKTLIGLSDKKLKTAKLTKVDQARALGELIAEEGLKKNITKAVFDRGGWQYHGRVKAACEGARKGGLKI